MHRFQRSIFPKSTRSTRKPEIRSFFPDRPSRRQKSRLIFPKSTKSTPKIYEIWVVEIRSPAAYHFSGPKKSVKVADNRIFRQTLANSCKLWQTLANSGKLWQTLRGQFSAVSTPNFASKYSLESSCRDLQDVHAFAPLRPHYSRWFDNSKISQSTAHDFRCFSA